MSTPEIDTFISRLEADPFLRVSTLSKETGVHKSVICRQLRAAGRDDLVTRYARQRASKTNSKYQRMLILLDDNPEMLVRDAANKVELHWNEKVLQEQMPAFIEYLETLPSVADLFSHHAVSKDAPGAIPILYSDLDEEIKEGKAYVFKPENKDNEFEQLDLSSFLEK